MLAHYRRLGEIRRTCRVFVDGTFSFLTVENGFVAYERQSDSERVVIAANCKDEAVILDLENEAIDLLSGEQTEACISVAPESARILKIQSSRKGTDYV